MLATQLHHQQSAAVLTCFRNTHKLHNI